MSTKKVKVIEQVIFMPPLYSYMKLFKPSKNKIYIFVLFYRPKCRYKGKDNSKQFPCISQTEEALAKTKEKTARK